MGVRQAHVADSGDLPVDRSHPTGPDRGRLHELVDTLTVT
jgi:hypothetical protein